VKAIYSGADSTAQLAELTNANLSLTLIGKDPYFFVVSVYFCNYLTYVP
jgi:hypothetical protein